MPRTFSHWGAYDVDVDGTGAVDLRPVGEDPDPTPLGANQIDSVDHALRIRRPAVRRGFLAEVESGRRGRRPSRGRGVDDFVELDWPEALDLVAAELERVRAAHGNEAIYAGSYGWASAGRFHNAQTQLYRFLDLIGGFVRSVNSYSYAAAEVILPHVVAPFFDVLGEHTSYEQLARHGRLVVAFGGLPAKNMQVENGGSFRHQAPGALRSMAEAGIRFVNVSPQRDDIDPALGAAWVPIRPGTDVALMLALGHVLVAEGRHDTDFLSRCCDGADRFLPALERCTPAWAAEVCDVEAGRIVELARDLAAGPSLVTGSWALQRAEHGEMAYWSLIALAALLGQIGTPGGGFGLGYGSVNRVGSSESSFSLARLPVGHNPIGTFMPVARITDVLSRPGEALHYDGAELTIPDVRLVYWCGGNPFHHHQDLGRLSRAWQLPETVVVHEQAWNPLARHADVVLPVSTTLERDDFGSSPLTGAVVAMSKVVDPPGEARSDHEIFADLACRFGVSEAFTEGLDVHGWLGRLWDESRRRAAVRGIELPELAELWDKGVVHLPRPERPRVLLADFRADPDGRPLRTPSGRIQLWSPVLEAFDVPDCPPLPSWLEPVEWLGAAAAQRFPLHLISNQPATRLHSQLDYGRTSRAGKVAGREPLRLHPEDAADRGIAAGDVVRVWNDRGACLAGAVVTDQVRPGVVVLPTGGWYDPVEPGGMCRHGNPNVLTSDRPASGLSQGPAAHSCLVEVERFEGEPPPVGIFTPPRFVSR
jgi:biotin/methionine sulfoxide reductase